MLLDSSGNTIVYNNLGIGTTSPGAKFHVTSTSTQPVLIYGDSGDTNGLFRIQMDSVSDSFGSGARTFLGDGGIDLFLGTGNSSYTPANTYIALNHSGEISMGAGAGTKHLVINTSGNVGINTTSPSYKLDVDGGSTTGAAFRATKQASAADGLVAYFTNSSNGGYSSYIYIGSNPGTDWKIGKNISNPTGTTYNFEIVDSSNNIRMQINNGTGNVTFSSDVIAYSDARLKKNIRNIENPLEKIMKTRGVLYDRIDTTEINTFGFIAQELEEIFPELVTTNEKGIKGVKYQNAVAVLVEAIKELKTEVEDLKYLLSQK
jgi:hypothetical protein